MASENTLKLRQERLYTKKGLPTTLLLNRKISEQRKAKANDERSASRD